MDNPNENRSIDMASFDIIIDTLLSHYREEYARAASRGDLIKLQHLTGILKGIEFCGDAVHDHDAVSGFGDCEYYGPVTAGECKDLVKMLEKEAKEAEEAMGEEFNKNK